MADGQDTPASRLSATPAGLGVGWIAQAVPFHASGSGVWVPVAPVPPTAMQPLALGQAGVESTPPQLGLGTV